MSDMFGNLKDRFSRDAAYFIALSLYPLVLIPDCLKLFFSNIGPRSYYLRGRLAELEQLLIQHMSTQLRNHGYMHMVGPDMFKTTVVVRHHVNMPIEIRPRLNPIFI